MHKISKEDTKWDFLVDNTQVALSKKTACIVGSRLAIWKITHADLKVYLEASEEVRAKRIVMREEGNYQDILQDTLIRDHNNEERYKQMYQLDITDYHKLADLIIKTDSNTIEESVSLILDALVQENFIEMV